MRYGETTDSSVNRQYHFRNAAFSFTFMQSQSEQYKEYSRGDLANTFTSFGSYLGLVLTCTYALLSTF